ncbi:alpha/beta fold hydrolase [Tateyamaria sp.]|uniref:alpha/beta fold hydrolase n=1 Tax=Tateyamaria sp. TaxID=1929288 RepID=UPI003B225333
MTWTIRPRSEGPGGLYYWTEGAGPPIVLIHGVGLRAEAWGGVALLLAKDFTVYAVDMPGHGASPLDRARSLSDYTARFSVFIDGLDAAPIVAGHSMGAFIALDLATRGANALRAVAALNAVFERSDAAASAVQARAKALDGGSGADPLAPLERWFGASPHGSVGAAAKACRTWLTSVDPEGYAQAYRVFAHHDGPNRAALAELQTPTLFLTGSQDPNSTPAMSHEMARLTPNGRAQIEADAAHMAPMTHAPSIATAIRALMTP